MEVVMKANVGNIDRGIRVMIGIAALITILVGPYTGTSWQNIALAAVGIIMIGTSSIKFCPLYRIFGMRTCPID